jgi:hypothetical protein
MAGTAVDRITPRPAPDEARQVCNATGFDDSCPVADDTDLIDTVLYQCEQLASEAAS